MVDLQHEHFVPLRKRELLALLGREPGLTPRQQEQFAQLSQILDATFHFEYHRTLQELLDAYAPFDPDADTVELHDPTPAEREAWLDQLMGKLRWLMKRANYLRLTQEDILNLSEGVSAWGIAMDVDFEAFERFDVYVRGDLVGKRAKRRWYKLWKLEELPLPIFQRLVGVLKLRKHPRIDPDIDVDDVYIKLFKEIPKMDMEMLFPGARVKFTRYDKSMIGYPLVTGLGMLGWKIWQTFWGVATAVAAGLTTWGIGILLGTIGYRSYYSYSVKKQMYTLKLTKSLYYQTLDSNAGVLTRLITEAEEQEWREAVLGYFLLWQRCPLEEGWTEPELDAEVERYLADTAKIKVNFECTDALEKLCRLGLVEHVGPDRFRAVPIDKGLQKLDHAWDRFFLHANTESAVEGDAA